MKSFTAAAVISTLAAANAGFAPVAPAPLAYAASPYAAAPFAAAAPYVAHPYAASPYVAAPAAYSAPLVAKTFAATPAFAAPAPYYAAGPAPYVAAPVAKTYAAAPFVAKTFAAPVVAAPAPVVAKTFAAPLAAPVAAVAAPVVAKAEVVDAHPQYTFAYNVQDNLSGDSKTQEETRDGDVVRGSYSLIEADGSRRIVNYYADSVNGFNAVVSKEAPVAVAPVVAAPAPVVAKTFAAPIVA